MASASPSDGVYDKKRLCAEQHAASLMCAEKNNGAGKHFECRDVFKAYRLCKKEETKARVLARNGGKAPSFFL